MGLWTPSHVKYQSDSTYDHKGQGRFNIFVCNAETTMRFYKARSALLQYSLISTVTNKGIPPESADFFDAEIPAFKIRATKI